MLGHVLTLNGQPYSSLDEIVALFVDRISNLAREMAEHPKFQPGDKREALGRLADMRRANPRRAVYLFWASYVHSPISTSLHQAFAWGVQVQLATIQLTSVVVAALLRTDLRHLHTSFRGS